MLQVSLPIRISAYDTTLQVPVKAAVLGSTRNASPIHNESDIERRKIEVAFRMATEDEKSPVI